MDADEFLARQLQAEEELFFQRHQDLQAELLSNKRRTGLSAFEGHLRSGVAQVLEYEDEVSQALALSTLPGSILELVGGPVTQQHELARRLLAWFKTEFFSWVNNPACEHCGSSNTDSSGRSPPQTEEEFEGRAQVVEVYQCRTCRQSTRFPRFNHPGKLLETRRGRCGEWANAFTLLCRATGLEVRYVRDWTDHVWTEFYSETEQRWIHMDACENAFDKPHLYEGGWGKKLSYAIGFGRCGATDVSRRYCLSFEEMQQRQASIADPEWVTQMCRSMSRRLRNGLGSTEAALWEERDLQELSELAQPCQSSDAPMPGRQTGSVEWRAARGELGHTPATPPIQSQAVEHPTPEAALQTDDTSAAPAAAPPKEAGQDQATAHLLGSSSEEPPVSTGTAAVATACKEPREIAPGEIAPAKEEQVAPTGKRSMDRDQFTRRMQAVFTEFMAEGTMSANEAALAALKRVRSEQL